MIARALLAIQRPIAGSIRTRAIPPTPMPNAMAMAILTNSTVTVARHSDFARLHPCPKIR